MGTPTPEWERIRARFHDALARGPEERAALLREIAAADPELAREVESLLAADSAAQGFLDAPGESAPGGPEPSGLRPGDKLGVFEIVATAGRGGMGDVYKARDLRLGRSVAIKVVLDRQAADGRGPDLRARERFEREARAISRLTHPHICRLYDVGSASPSPGEPERPFLVMEFLEGRTLADRLKDGPLDPADALRHAIAIADALAAAHAHGIVHRDLKPGNVMLTDSGVKLLDFGLAQLRAGGRGLEDGAAREEPSQSSLSSRGLIAGTLRYMSPEQLRGEPTDVRSDIFACGVVLHEMLTGRPPFDAADDASVIAAVLAGTPPPIDTNGSPIGRMLTPIVARCLAKEPDRRWPRMDDLGAALRAVREGHEPALAQTPRPKPIVARGGWWRGLRLAAAGAVIGALSIVVLLAARARHAEPTFAPQGMTRVSILPPEGVRFDIVQISPDGRRLAFTGWTPQGSRIWMRALDSDAAHALPDTEDAQGPVFWSPDSRYLAFVLRGSLVAFDTVNSTTRVICEVKHVISGTWGADGVILFAAVKSPENGLRLVAAPDGALRRVTAGGGGQSTLIVPAEAEGDDSACLFPHFLPDGHRYLYSLHSPDPRRAGVYLGELGKNKRAKRVLPDPSPVQYVQSGHLLFLRENSIMAQPFDLETGDLQGEATVIARADNAVDVRRRMVSSVSGRFMFFSASQTGVLVHAPNPIPLDQLAWHDRVGRRQQTVGEPAAYAGFALSPDGARVAAVRSGDPSTPWNLWLLDLTRDVSSRLTFGSVDQFDPRWAPDGRRIAVAAMQADGRDNFKELTAVTLDGHGTPLYRDATRTASLDDWSPDGRTLLYHSDRSRELFAVPVTGKQPPALIWRSPSAFPPDQARFSPDGRWIAYHAQDSGRAEVYVTRFPEAGERWQVSSAGGVQPMWRGDGRELYYLGLDGRLFAVPIETAGTFQPAAPQALFQTPIGPSTYTEQYAVDKTGTRFLLLEPDPRAPAPVIDVIVNWSAALSSRATHYGQPWRRVATN